MIMSNYPAQASTPSGVAMSIFFCACFKKHYNDLVVELVPYHNVLDLGTT